MPVVTSGGGMGAAGGGGMVMAGGGGGGMVAGGGAAGSCAGVCGGAEAMCIEAEGAVKSVNWQYVGDGCGKYNKVQQYNFVGEGCGAYDQETVVVNYGWKFRPCCFGGVGVFAVVVLLVFMRP